MADRKLFEALYQSVARDMQKMKGELLKELSNTSAQVGALGEAVKVENPNDDVVREIRYTQKQLQSLYEGIENVVTEKMEAVQNSFANINTQLDEQTNKIVTAIGENKPEAIDYDRLATLVAEKVTPVDYDRLADLVAEKLAAKEQTYEVVVDDAGIDSIAEKVSAKLGVVEAEIDYDRIGDIVESKLGVSEETSYDLVLDEDGINAIVQGVADELRNQCVCEAPASAPVEEPVVEEVAEEPAIEEVVEEPIVEETVEEVVAEPDSVEEASVPVEAPVAQEEIAVSEDPVLLFDELDENNLIDAETGLVIRLKKSFTAKLKQSEENIKEYYSQVKNELTSYKKINSNVSWHGDRFNYGRDTIAKMNICGKTLCVYLALDPNDPEFKSTVYHQKDVGNQKAYESTPFMVKVKSDAAAKKAVRLAAALAEKLATEKDENFAEVDYVTEYAYETTKKLYEDGFIKATKEKKVDLNF